jgi:hypothetical protein
VTVEVMRRRTEGQKWRGFAGGKAPYGSVWRER